MKIRALTIFASNIDKDKIENYANQLSSINDSLIWSKRIAFPPKSLNEKIIGKIPENKDIIYSIIHLSQKDNLSLIKDILSVNENFYGSILLNNPSYVDNVSKFIYDLEPQLATRVAVLIYDDFLTTPYFPVGSANTLIDSMAISLIYPREFLDGNAQKALSVADEYAKKIATQLKLKYLGIDVSLSPWKEESVAEIIEKRSGKLFSFGNMSTVAEINKEIFEIAWKLKITPIGFSEVMLPVAEDNVLIERVNEGTLTLQGLFLLTSVCVAGIDMVVVKKDYDLIRKILKDSMALQIVKRRPYGVRLIPSTDSGYVYLKDYGRIPEIKTL
ncbi:DUF711 family protein [Sulfolobus acidocaldarius]|uniref:Conserved protein n=4 Tax=Sulfolobus acidocaldarius TaxID=2285 RepID=Q4J8T7_SULAC|nr:DUF711 family protein [Sulfolobus acidocaldarius]AAY80793.1 conserved protein [Sulfolobus acidocaldarius DSM 639]AGE71392.1 hypothetical protein SacN8_07140 [Sulfolobus acidocaldarius N8]AGE73663.1 hypothetical protein SacRon12I_07140 [Sulfolobus acidocaldarius Ron12/I]ALU31081.1 hypothetical protein ATZ20_02235 [Sulfolobus acidocaldarius]WCM35303.1 DUF711 family protein [Sulfolobus acidocaldarius DSM 639]